MSGEASGSARVGTVLGKVKDDLQRQADERWRQLPDSALVAFVWQLEMRQWDLQLRLADEDDVLESAKLRGAMRELQDVLDTILAEAARRRVERAREDSEVDA